MGRARRSARAAVLRIDPRNRLVTCARAAAHPGRACRVPDRPVVRARRAVRAARLAALHRAAQPAGARPRLAVRVLRAPRAGLRPAFAADAQAARLRRSRARHARGDRAHDGAFARLAARASQSRAKARSRRGRRTKPAVFRASLGACDPESVLTIRGTLRGAGMSKSVVLLTDRPTFEEAWRPALSRVGLSAQLTD